MSFLYIFLLCWLQKLIRNCWLEKFARSGSSNFSWFSLFFQRLVCLTTKVTGPSRCMTILINRVVTHLQFQTLRLFLKLFCLKTNPFFEMNSFKKNLYSKLLIRAKKYPLFNFFPLLDGFIPSILICTITESNIGQRDIVEFILFIWYFKIFIYRCLNYTCNRGKNIL